MASTIAGQTASFALMLAIGFLCAHAGVVSRSSPVFPTHECFPMHTGAKRCYCPNSLHLIYCLYLI